MWTMLPRNLALPHPPAFPSSHSLRPVVVALDFQAPLIQIGSCPCVVLSWPPVHLSPFLSLKVTRAWWTAGSGAG